jgi:outer membrane autotransporter barrel domain
MTLVNSGSIIGGIAGNSGPRSDAVLFTGGTNTLELRAGSAITGNVDANTGSNTLALGGDADSTFDASLIGPTAQYQGFTRYAKTGASTWSLTNSTDSVTPWTLYEGALRITDDAALGDTSGTLTFDGGTLQLGASLALAATRPVLLAGGGGTIDTQAFTGTVSGVISGVGALTKEGSGTLILTGMDNYTGGTRIDGGVLQLGDGGTSGSITGDVQDGGTLVFNRSDSLIFSGSINNGADGTPGRVVQAGTGTTLLTGVSTYSGGTEVNQGSLLVGDATHASASLAGGGTVDVAAAAAFGGYGTVVGDVTNAGTLVVADAAPALAGEGSGSFTVVGTLTNAGTANLAGAGAGNRLIVSNYVGSNATINLNTVVNGDDSPSDRLVIDGGTATGTTALRVSNAGGLGAATPGNGIMLVQAQAGAVTAPGAFTLGNRVAAGPYLYTLFRGARDGSSTESWYLRSENTNPPPGITTPQVVPPTTLPPGETVPPVVPEYRPEVSLYTALPSMALNYGRALTGTLHERVGDEAQVPASQGDSVPSSAWARVVGQDGQWDARSGGIYRDGPSFDDNVVAVQAGADLWHDESDAHARDFAGVMGAVGHGHGRVDNFDGTTAGNDKFDAYTLGGYWTHYTQADAYIDGVLQGTWYHARATSPYHNEIKSNGFGWSASLEGGYPFKLAQDWTLEPQAQVIYQRLNLDSAHDDAGSVHFDNATSLVSRVGARLTHAWQPAGGTGRPTVGWLLANAWHESRGNAKTAFGSADGDVPFHSDLGSSWWELGVGATAALGDRGSLYATVSYEKAFGDGVKAFNSTVGYRLNW